MMSMILRYLLGIQLLEEQIIRQFFNWLPDIAAVVHGIADRPLFTVYQSLIIQCNIVHTVTFLHILSAFIKNRKPKYC